MLFGYQTFSEFTSAVFKNIDSDLVVKYLIPAAFLLGTFFDTMFQSPEAIYFLITMYLIDFLTGISKATYYSFKAKEYKQAGNIEEYQKVRHRTLVSKKFPRFLMTMIVALFLLVILNFSGRYVIVFYPLYSIFYAVFLGQQIISIAENLTELKLLPLSILNKIKLKITEYGSN